MSVEHIELDSILHKASIIVDRNGTRASAVTFGGCYMGVSDKATVVINRPFIYAVMNRTTKLPVFSGCVNQL